MEVSYSDVGEGGVAVNCKFKYVLTVKHTPFFMNASKVSICRDKRGLLLIIPNTFYHMYIVFIFI